MLQTFHEALNLGRSFEVEGRFRRWDGEFRWFLFRGSPLLDDSGNVVRWYGTNTDLEERKRAEDALRQSEADLHEAQRLSHTGSWKHDPSSGIVTISPEVHCIFGIRPQEDPSKADFFFGRIHPEDRAAKAHNYQRAILAKTDFESYYRIVLPDGSVKHIHNVGHPILNESGSIKEFVGTTMDVTQQVKTRTELEKACAEIEALKDQLYKENLALRDEVDRVSMFEEIVGTSPALQALLSRVIKVALTAQLFLSLGRRVRVKS